MEDFVENEFVKIWKEGDVVYAFYKKNGNINLNAAKEIVQLRLKFQNGESYCIIAFTSSIITFTPEAREYLATTGYEGVNKVAIVSNSRLPILIGNVFFYLKTPRKPTKLFNTEQDALRWINSK